jgi:hypothetical protein
VPCTQAGCSLHNAVPSRVSVPLLPLPECLQSPMNLAAQLDGGAASAGAAQVNNSKRAIERLILVPQTDEFRFATDKDGLDRTPAPLQMARPQITSRRLVTKARLSIDRHDPNGLGAEIFRADDKAGKIEETDGRSLDFVAFAALESVRG